jgi:hypothetical protein
MTLFATNKEWVFSGIGVFVLSVTLSSVVWLFARLRAYRLGLGRFTGLYEVYQCGVKDRSAFIRGVLRVGSVWTGSRAEYRSHRNIYRGRLRTSGQTVFVELTGIDIAARKYCIFADPMADFEALVGVSASITAFRHLPMAGRVLLKRCHDHAVILPLRLPEDQVPEPIRRLVRASTETQIIVNEPPFEHFADLSDAHLEDDGA